MSGTTNSGHVIDVHLPRLAVVCRLVLLLPLLAHSLLARSCKFVFTSKMCGVQPAKVKGRIPSRSILYTPNIVPKC